MDALSDVLAAARLSAVAFLHAEFTAPWCIIAQVGEADCRPLGAVPPHIIAYHYVVDGSLRLELPGAPVLQLHAGDIVMLPRNDPHVLASAAHLRPQLVDNLIQPLGSSGLAELCYGGGGAATHLICGFLGCELPRSPLLETLPAVLHLPLYEDVAGVWVSQSFHLAAEEFAANRLGSTTVLNKLAELLFVEAVRRYLSELPAGQTGWLAGLRDPFVGRALALLHHHLALPWTTEGLAREVGLSRSAFAERFTRLVGQPPMHYLAHWRLQSAALRLRDGGQLLAQIAFDVGYESEAAFNRAFKREFGLPPATWRRQQAPH
ncbi:AraC family transcriptional regulator [Pseudomonas sp. UL073]|uniref:AraC family transcriptional regulator n=1 Tax=Zestomonas insulae TaxID=2809017 RepID=A0ABS2IHE5_9GAMM|nr:AraC family transcriptional regulator [Pseudomonas insulae]MBM7062485.1 AraC family transcriptional regulator [Pseudomonas insulae]